MLSREICKKCVGINPSVVSIYSWTPRDDFHWDESEVMYCPASLAFPGSDNTTPTESPPPDWCPYMFEHAVAAGKTNVE